MCGLSGIISQQAIARDKLAVMHNAIVHRGPDAEGFYYDEQVGLAHRRLAIIDLSTMANQPFQSQDDLVIIFNGEIYNYIELRKELMQLSYQFTTQSDTEVIANAYRAWGVDCVKKFNGMWAFILYDKHKQRIFCSRDRFGIKPFYYYQQAGSIYFASEIKQLTAIMPSTQPNLSALANFLVTSYYPTQGNTFFQQINALPAAHNLLIDLNSFRISTHCYYHLQVKSLDETDHAALIDQYNDVLSSAVHLRLRSDVKLGSCLSGGLDSSSICAIAGETLSEFNTFTACSQDERDESHYAKLINQQINAKAHYLTLDDDTFFTHLTDLATVQEEPFASPSVFMQFMIFRLAKQHGVKVLLDGQGGDETLLGYERYFPVLLSQKTGIEQLRQALFISRNSQLSFLQVWQYYVFFRHAAIRRTLLQRRAAAYIKPDIRQLAKDIDSLDAVAQAYGSCFELQRHELIHSQLPHLLQYEDRNSMYASIESRLPFLDYRLVEFSLSLPIGLKLYRGWTKYILRKAMETRMPEAITWRKHKVGFEAPEARWHRAALTNTALMQRMTKNPLLREIMLKDSLTVKYLTRLDRNAFWKLLSVACWAEVYL